MGDPVFKNRFCREGRRVLAGTLAALLILSGQVHPALAVNNALFNPGFEQGLGGAGNWDNTPNRGLSTPIVAGAPEGQRILRISEAALAGGEFGFTFQGPAPVKPGARVSLTGLARLAVDDGDGDEPQIVIEFHGSYGTDVHPVGTTSPTFTRITQTAVAPAGTTGVVAVVRLQGASTGGGTSVGEFDDLQATISDQPVTIEAAVSRDEASPGEMVMVIARVFNNTVDTLSNVEVVAKPQAGINIDRHQAALNGSQIEAREGSVIFSLGSLASGSESILTFPAVLTSGIQPGKTYEIALTAKFTTTGSISETTHVKILVRNDPVFDEGTIIGKVFNDTNQNGVQDEGEKGVPAVRLVTEEGIIIITDKDGKYSIPAVKPGRHIVKIDGHTLPEGTKFITEESYLVKTTPGILNKANFAILLPPSDIPVEFNQDLDVHFTQGVDTSRPSLGVDMNPGMLKAGLGTLEQSAVFKFHINYPDFVKNWYLEVRDQAGRDIWTGFGVSAPPPEVTWNGQMEDGLLIKPGIYSYRLRVEDYQGHDDWTPLHFFQVISKADPEGAAKKMIEIPEVGNFNIFKDGKSSIPLIAKPTIRIQGTTRPGYQVKINNRPIPVDSDGQFSTEFYVTPGDKEFTVEAVSPSGEITTYKKSMKVKDSTFFMVALSEEQMGVNFNDGNLETVGRDNQYKDEFYQDGRVSYFLRGKLKGKFLYESHYDTDDKRSALFRNLDPTKYYPIYGDDSQISYDGINTQQRFYLLIEMDRSYVKWGSYETNFTDTELSSYNRTLSGFKTHYESLDTTSYGDAKKGFTAFWAQSRQKPDHNEFAATGGSLYYLRNRRVIEGSEKLRVEIRDKIQGMTIDSRDLQEGKDYEINYDEGRIMLNRPLSSVAAADTLVSVDILDGSPVYLVVDYEYDAGPNAVEDGDKGLRGFMHMGNHIRVGATAVQEDRHGGPGTNYDMRGVDMQMKFGRNTKITTEYAETQQQQKGQAVSYNGGLSFSDRSVRPLQRTRAIEKGYLVKGETMPTDKWQVSGYLQGLEPNFSNDQLISQTGARKYGIATKYDIAKNLYARYRYDHNEFTDELQPVSQVGVLIPFDSRITHTAQLVYDDGKWLGEAEYLRQNLNIAKVNGIPSIYTEFPFDHGLAFKLGYRITDKIFPYAKFQTTIHPAGDYQIGGGIRYQLLNDVSAYVEEMVGNIGDSTLFGVEKYHDQRARSYANIRMRDELVGTRTMSTTIGSSYSLTEKSRIYSERENSTYNSINGYGDIYGYEGNFKDHWDYDLRFERRHLDGSSTRLLDQSAAQNLVRNNSSNVASGALAYADKDRLKARTMLEVRRDADLPDMLQWLTRNAMEYRINQDLRYLGRLDFGKSRFLEPNDTVGQFMEFNTGFAFRPVAHDKFNMLSRYTFLFNQGSDAQFLNGIFNGVEVDETAHIMAVDLAYDVHKYVTLVEKLAYKYSIMNSSVTRRELMLHNFLWANRFNYHVTKKWDAALEYRMLWQFDIVQTLRQGALVEIDRELYDYVRLGIGYNFTDFDDDLRKTNNYSSHGPFVRMTGKF